MAPGRRDASPVRLRLLDSAHDAIEASGWSSVTMSGVAVRAGVSRQTVYNEFGTKHGLAEQLALRELDRFLDVVRVSMSSGEDLVEGIRATCQGVLEMAEQSLLVRTIVGSAPSQHDSDFLQILTTESGEIVAAAVTVVRQCVEQGYPPTPLSPDQLDVVVESVVRLVLSAIARPSKPPAETAENIAWIVGLVLRGTST